MHRYYNHTRVGTRWWREWGCGWGWAEECLNKSLFTDVSDYEGTSGEGKAVKVWANWEDDLSLERSQSHLDQKQLREVSLNSDQERNHVVALAERRESEESFDIFKCSDKLWDLIHWGGSEDPKPSWWLRLLLTQVGWMILRVQWLRGGEELHLTFYHIFFGVTRYKRCLC